MALNELVAFIYTLINGVRVDAAAGIKQEEEVTAGYMAIKPHMLLKKIKDEGSNFKENSLSGGEICCVCLSSMEEGDDDMRVLPCLHQFHKGCVDRWLDGCRKNCPICRFSIGEEERFHIREAFTEEMLIWFSSFHVAGF